MLSFLEGVMIPPPTTVASTCERKVWRARQLLTSVPLTPFFLPMRMSIIMAPAKIKVRRARQLVAAVPYPPSFLPSHNASFNSSYAC